MKSTPNPVKFEAAMEALEQIVSYMENGELPLEDLIGRYEEGIALVKACHEKLAEAEQKIEVLTRPKAEKPAKSKAPADPDSDPAPPALF